MQAQIRSKQLWKTVCGVMESARGLHLALMLLASLEVQGHLPFTQPLDATYANELLCLRQVSSLRLPADKQPQCPGALVALYQVWVENTWLRRDLAFRIIVPLQSFDQQQILCVPDNSYHSAGSAVRLEGCNNTKSIA